MRGEKHPRSTSSRRGGQGECYTCDYGDYHFGAKCIFDHSVTKKHRPSSDHGGGGGRGGVNSSGNGGGGGKPIGARAMDGRFNPRGGDTDPGSSGGAGGIEAKGGFMVLAAPPGS